MKKLIFVVLILSLFGCSNIDEIEQTKKLLDKMEPMGAKEQAAAIKECESNAGWTGKPVTFNAIVVQIRCVKGK